MSDPNTQNNAGNDEPKREDGFIKGMLVVEVKTGKQMRIKAIETDGIVCVKGSLHEEPFAPAEIMEFDKWVAESAK